MVEKEFNSYFEKTFNTLSDLAVLLGPDASPMINQAGFYLSRLKDINERTAKLDKVDGPVYNFIHDSFIELIRSFLISKNELVDIVISGDGCQYSLSSWNRILETIPELLSIINLFKLSGGIELRLEDNGLRVITQLDSGQNLVKYRRKCYEIVRKLFGKKTLLTFNIDEEQGEIKLNLFLNISHSDKLIYECCIGNVDTRIAFSNVFDQYIIGSYSAEKLPDHICLEITDELKLNKYNRIPKRFTQVLGDHQIIHFSFLFRPVSIIIPCRGRVTQNTLISRSGDTGSGKNCTEKQDVDVFYADGCGYVDIFDLISS